jgi:hypothetical protein
MASGAMLLGLVDAFGAVPARDDDADRSATARSAVSAAVRWTGATATIDGNRSARASHQGKRRAGLSSAGTIRVGYEICVCWGIVDRGMGAGVTWR